AILKHRKGSSMAKATTTIRQSLNYQSQHAEYFAANQALFNRVVAFYFDCIQAHEGVLDLKNKEALMALEMLTHATQKNPLPAMPLSAIAEQIPAYFRRGAINAALGSARSFYAQLAKWRRRRDKAEAKPTRKGKKKFTGVAFSQEGKSKKGPSLSDARQGDDNAHG